jgi:hypothetical protein
MLTTLKKAPVAQHPPWHDLHSLMQPGRRRRLRLPPLGMTMMMTMLLMTAMLSANGYPK